MYNIKTKQFFCSHILTWREKKKNPFPAVTEKVCNIFPNTVEQKRNELQL